MIIPIIWHHLQVHQEPSHPPRLQGETWRTGGVLTGFLMSNLDETFREASLECSLPSETITRCVRNLHFLQDPRKRLGGQVESWQASWGPIFEVILITQSRLCWVLYAVKNRPSVEYSTGSISYICCRVLNIHMLLPYIEYSTRSNMVPL